MATAPLVLIACAPTVRSASEQAVKGAAPAAADAGLSILEDQRTRQRLAEVLATPEMQQAMGELSAGLSDGVVKRLGSDEMAVHTTKLVDQFTRAFMTAFGQSMRELTPPGGALEERADRLASTIAASVTRSMAREIPQSLAPALHRAIADDLGPAMGEVMHKDMAPGFAAMLKSPDVQSALAETTHEVARQAVLGSNMGLAELTEKKKHDEGGSPLGSVGAFFATRTWLLVLVIATAVFSLPLVWLLRERKAATRYRQEAERRTNRAAALLAAIERTGERGWSPSVLELLREQLGDGDEGRDSERPPEHGRGQPRHA
jgi:hypothetical protein